jgi:hypothetical protein
MPYKSTLLRDEKLAFATTVIEFTAAVFLQRAEE